MVRKGVIFDFDGTIALSEPLHMKAWEEIAHAKQWDLPNGFLESGIGRTDKELCFELANAWRQQLTAEELLQLKRFHYQRLARTSTELVHNADIAIKAFAARAPIAIATSACLDDITPALQMFDLEKHFDAILTIDDVTKPKPDPEIYLKTAIEIGCQPGDCWVFEDSRPGIEAASAAGMQVVAMLTTYQRHELPATVHAIEDYSDLEALIRMIWNK